MDEIDASPGDQLPDRERVGWIANVEDLEALNSMRKVRMLAHHMNGLDGVAHQIDMRQAHRAGGIADIDHPETGARKVGVLSNHLNVRNRSDVSQAAQQFRCSRQADIHDLETPLFGSNKCPRADHVHCLCFRLRLEHPETHGSLRPTDVEDLERTIRQIGHIPKNLNPLTNPAVSMDPNGTRSTWLEALETRIVLKPPSEAARYATPRSTFTSAVQPMGPSIVLSLPNDLGLEGLETSKASTVGPAAA